MRALWAREMTGATAALALALVIAGQVASTARSELVFRDADSLVVALLSRSFADGTAADWAMSSVLFLPETGVFLLLDALLPWDPAGLLAANAVVNLLAVYGAIRVAAGARGLHSAPVIWSLIATAVFGLAAMTEVSASRNALELASLTLTTTYYSAAVIATIAAIGLVRRLLDRPAGGGWLLGSLVVIVAVSTLTNPLFAVWCAVPLLVLLGVQAVRGDSRTRSLASIAALLIGIVAGLTGRIPFAAWIANTGVGYARPERWADAASYYAGLVGDRLASPLGVLGVLITIALLVLAVHRTARATEPGMRIVAAMAWLSPLLVVVGAVALGTEAARYLQPVAFLPVLSLVADPRMPRAPRRGRRAVLAPTAVVLAVAATLSIPRLDAAAHAPDADLTCVTDWVDQSGRTGAGQFWTVRLPKLHLDDPSRLVQVDHELRGYAWLVDRADFAVGEVSFLVEDAQTVPWSLPVDAAPVDVVTCGRYRIVDFGSQTLPLGPQRS